MPLINYFNPEFRIFSVGNFFCIMSLISPLLLFHLSGIPVTWMMDFVGLLVN